MARVFKRPEVPVLMSVSEMFARDITLNIPKWQREYSWDADEEVRELLEDLEKFVISKRDNYVLGSILTYSLKDGSHAIVDGQQRTVTLFTMLLAVRDVFEFRITTQYESVSKAPAGYQALLQQIDSLTRKISLDNDARISIPIFMEYGEGNQVLTALAIKSPLPSGVHSLSQENILSAYNKCKDFLSQTYVSSESLAEFIKALTQGTFIIETHVGDQRHALDVFFKMNVRGRSIESSDYVKLFLFQKFDDSKYDELTEIWSAMSRALRSADSSRSKLKTPEFFLRNCAIVDKGDKISGDLGTYEHWQQKFEADPELVSGFLSELKERASTFSKIAGNKIIQTGEENLAMIGADYFKGTQFIPVLLAGSKLSKYDYLSQLVNARYLLYIFSQERTQDFESMIPKWAKAIDGLKGNASTSDIDSATASVTGICFDPARLEVLRSKIRDLNSKKDERKIRLILSTASMRFESELTPLSEFLKKYKSSNRKGFDFDLILGQSHFSDYGVSADELPDFLGIGNSTLVNGLSKHYSNKLPHAKEGLYAGDQAAITASLGPVTEISNPKIKKAVLEIHKVSKSKLRDWNHAEVIGRRDFIVESFISSIPNGLLVNQDK